MGLEKVRIGGDTSTAALSVNGRLYVIIGQVLLTWTSIISSDIVSHVYME